MDLFTWTAGHLVGRLVLPPTSLLLLIAVGLWWRHKRWGLWVASSSLVLLWLLSMPVVAHTLWDLLTHTPPVPALKLSDVPKERAMIVVLTAGKRAALEYPAGETPSPLTVQRARYAAWLARESGLRLAIAGGKLWGKWSEGELTRSFVETELKQPVSLVEDKGRDTRQAAINLAEPLRRMKVDFVVLVTDARHMPRASQAFAGEGFRVVPAPIEVNKRHPSFSPGGFIPTASALVVSAAVSHEIIGRVWYRARSILGLISGR